MRTLRSAPPGFRLTERDAEILAKVFWARAIDRDSLLISMGFGSVGRLNARLGALVRGGYLRRVAFPKGNTAVRSVYLVGQSSVDLLSRGLDVDRSEVSRIARQRPERAYVEHSLLVVALELAIRASASAGGLQVEEFLHESACRHEYVVSAGGRNARKCFKPDALAIVTDGTRRWHVFVEADRANTSANHERRNFEGYAAYATGIFQETYVAPSFHVCLVTTAGDRRVSHLVRLTEGLAGPTFHFTTVARLSLGGFFAPIWERLGGERPEGPLGVTEVLDP